jgi:hypothetical protein
MKLRVFTCCLISLSTVSVFHVVGEEESGTPLSIKLESSQPPETLNRFGLSYRMGFNIPVHMRNFGSFSSAPNPKRNLDNSPYNYDNGYVYPDAGTPNSGVTHYWGYSGFTYNGSSQLPGNGTILMQRTSSAGLNSEGRENDPQSGLELTYNRELGRNKNLRWGLEAAFNYMNVSIDDSRPLAGNASLRTDAFALQVPESLMPPPGYQGRKNNPGVVIGSTPQSSETLILETVTGSRKLDADIFGLRLGPCLEIPVSKHVSVGFSGGLSLAEINSNFRYTETIQAGPVKLPSTRGSGSNNDLLAGGYVEGNVSCSLNRSTGVFAGVQFQDLGQYSHKINSREAVLDLGKSIFVTLGLSYSF